MHRRPGVPELPDVQVFRERLESNALDRPIRTLRVRDDRMLRNSPSTLRRHLRGAELTATRRHGKHLFVRIEEGERWLRLHFGMTGEIRWIPPEGTSDGADPEADSESGSDDLSHQALRFDLEGGGSLVVLNTRRLGQIGLVDDPDAWVEDEGLGPDPLQAGFGPASFRDALQGRRGTVKGTLMNQEVLAGLGNIYTDETLFQVGVHPERPVPELEDGEIEDLHRALRRVCEHAVEARVRAEHMPAHFLIRCREDGAECPKCGGALRKIRVSGRSTYLCEEHQSR